MNEYIVEARRVQGDGYSGRQFGEIKEEIIRCDECAHYVSETLRFSDGDGGSTADLVSFCNKLKRETDPDGFCAWAEAVD